MAKCDITIQFDASTYSSGQRVRGVARADVDRACSQVHFTATLMALSSGYGTTTKHPSSQIVLHNGSWEAGKTYEYSFEFTAPNGPFTHHGSVASVSWAVECRADLPWARDPKELQGFSLIPSAELTTYDFGKLHKPAKLGEHIASRVSGATGCGMTMLMLTLPVGLVLLAEGKGGGVIILLFALVIGFFTLRSTMAQHRLGTVTTSLNPPILRPGQAAEICLTFAPKAGVHLNSVTLDLMGEEYGTRGSGKNQTRRSAELYRNKLESSVKGDMPAGQLVEARFPITLPRNLPMTTELASNSRIRYFANLRIDVANWPDWKVSRVPVTVGPPVTAAIAAQSSQGARDLGGRGKEPVATGSALAAEQAPASGASRGSIQTAPKSASSSKREPSVQQNAEANAPTELEPIHVTAPAPAKPSAGGQADTLARLVETLRELKTTDRQQIEGRIAELIKESETYTGSVEIGSVRWTFGVDTPDQLKDGRSVVCRVDGGIEIHIRFPKAENDRLDDLRRGDRVDVVATLNSFDPLFGKAVLDVDR